MRIDGLVSGMLTEDVISKMMQVERQPLLLMQTRQRSYQLRKDLWSEVNSSLLSLKTKTGGLLDEAKLTQKKAASSDDSLFTAVADNEAASATYDINVEKMAKNQRVSGSVQDTGALGLAGSFTIGDGENSATIEVVATDTLRSIMAKINGAKDISNPEEPKDLQVSATIINNTLVLEHKLTGAANNLVLSDSVNNAGATGSDEILESLGLLEDSKSIANQLQAAEDAQLTINGLTVTSASNTLKGVISGVDLTLKKEGAGTLEVLNDVDSSLSLIKEWVAQYNSTINLIDTRLSEETVKDAVSDAMKSKGLLRGDSTLFGIKNQMRLNLTYPVAGLAVFERLSDIGITTTSADYGKSGKLVIDEAKLRKALEENPAEVSKLFANNSDIDGDGKISVSEKGYAVRLEEQLEYLTSTSTRSIGGVVVKAGVIPSKMQYEEDLIKDYSNKIQEFEKRLQLREASLWKQFNAMEMALSNLQSQATWLAGQLAGLMSY